MSRNGPVRLGMGLVGLALLASLAPIDHWAGWAARGLAFGALVVFVYEVGTRLLELRARAGEVDRLDADDAARHADDGPAARDPHALDEGHAEDERQLALEARTR